jgi:WD40 repeat protein
VKDAKPHALSWSSMEMALSASQPCLEQAAISSEIVLRLCVFLGLVVSVSVSVGGAVLSIAIVLVCVSRLAPHSPRFSILPHPRNMPLSPAQPVYILRGHSASIHAVLFIRSNSRLITADAEGWIVLWNVSTRRPVAVWKAHEASILGAAPWGDDRIITWVFPRR